jgi:hypothetical protein
MVFTKRNRAIGEKEVGKAITRGQKERRICGRGL